MPSIRDIELEASRRAAADGRTSRRERFQIRNQLRSQYGLDPEEKQRGGVAGVWDRNKGAIGSVAGGLAASFIPGAGAFLAPALGGILGGSAARGRFEGGNVLGDALGGMGGGGVKSLASSFMPRAAAQAGSGAAVGASQAVPLGGTMAGAAPSAAATAVPGRLSGMLASAGNFAKANPEVVAMGLQGAGQAMQANANRRMADRSMDFQERQYEDEQERRRRIAELLAPMWQARQAAPAPAMPGLPMLGGR